ncbi:histidinol-phosphate transaminase [Corynebacterium pyruviciproducens ATCC BAA-1742]|uniref:Histidinol-phosphate aminotransferase n=1 Tax=Corynebacterium pyruviciproducens ATCC BAA-1742 TaxID=1125779 RepID=S2Z161_9CORY|nr:histidinol-phosphate transaminase [Corynebacterium pyruviciproducens]EPD68030.1 histidinol-phosphate transaminase [Corynebacterium pyruviciproducens ATCC BAA-1742]
MLRGDLTNIPSYVPGKKETRAVKLSSNELAHGALPSVKKALDTVEVNRYPDMFAVELRKKLAAAFGLDFTNVAVGCGSSALCQQLVQITCLDRDDEVIYPWRSFEAYPIFVDVCGATKVAIPLKDGAVDLDAIAAAITNHTKLIFLCNPNNPTGTVFSGDQFDAFMKHVPADVVVALDEAYIEFADVESGVSKLSRHPNLVVLRTFSKAYGLAGLRVGYALASAELIDALIKVAIPFAVSAPAQAAALASLEAQDELAARVAEVKEQRARVQESLGTVPSQANFVWLPGQKFEKDGVIVRNFPEGTRITVTTPEETDALLG